MPFGESGNGTESAEDAWVLRFGIQNDRFILDLTGLPLDDGLCRAARKKEIGYFRSKGVWELGPINEARVKMGRPPNSGRWVETNKGDDVNPNVRS